MKRTTRLRMALGGAVCGSFLGILGGALAGALYGAWVGNVSLGLDGALLGGCLVALAGAAYGAALRPPSTGLPLSADDSIATDEPVHVPAERRR